MAGREAVAAASLVAGLCVPFGVMVAHLNLTRLLSPQEKTPWREALWVGPFAIVAIASYLLSGDLVAATKGLRRAQP